MLFPRSLSSLVALSAVGLATALDIESPSGGHVDISKPVNISWTQPDPPNGNFYAIDVKVRFYMDKPGEEGTTLASMWVAAANRSISTPGWVEWDPKEVREDLEKYHADGYEDEVESAQLDFDVIMKGREFEHGSIVATTEGFSLFGFEGGPDSEGALVRPAWVVLAAGVGAIAAQAWVL